MNTADDPTVFVTRYGGIYEHSPWVAEQCYAAARKVTDARELGAIFARCVDNANQQRKLELICAHPDLAGRAAVRGYLTVESGEEQASAGIDQCSPDEFERFERYNRHYRDKFGFPFVMAVRGSRRQDILEAFALRLENDYETEFKTAIGEIHKIARLRLLAMEERDE